MSCPHCGSSTCGDSCQTDRRPSSDSWGGNFGSWGTSSSDWDKVADAGDPRSQTVVPQPRSNSAWAERPPSGSSDTLEGGWGWAPQTATLAHEDPGAEKTDDELSSSWEQARDEAWLDDEEDSVDQEAAPSPADVGRSAGRLWLASLLVGGLLLGGAWVAFQPTTAAAPPLAASLLQERIESLHRGRRLAAAGAANLQLDPEAAALQLQSAIKDLKQGQAGPAEVGRVRGWLAESLMASRSWEKAFRAWEELSSRPEFKVEAAQGLRLATIKLLALADAHLLNAEGSLKAQQFRQAESQAAEALRLYEILKAKSSKKGMAYGAMGFANLGQQRTSLAVEYLSKAADLYPQGPYVSVLAGLAAPEPNRSSVSTKPVGKPIELELTVGDDAGVPVGKKVNSTKKKVAPASDSARPTSDNQTAEQKKTKEIAAAAKKKNDPGRHTEKNSFNMDDQSASHRL